MRLSAQSLSCRRGGRLIFADVDFTLRRGEALIVTGDNGAGKSSLLAIVAGLLIPASGVITLDDAGDRRLAECIALVGHRDGLKAQLTAVENLGYAQRLLGASGRSSEEGLAAVNMSHAADLPVAVLSAGQRRRVALARLLVCNRPIWLMDEPAGALDAGSLRLLTGLMGDHLDAGGMIIAATHQPLGERFERTLHLVRPALSEGEDDEFLEDDWEGELGWPLDGGSGRHEVNAGAGAPDRG